MGRIRCEFYWDAGGALVDKDHYVDPVELVAYDRTGQCNTNLTWVSSLQAYVSRGGCVYKPIAGALPTPDPQAFKADGGKPRFDLLMDGMPNALLDVVKVLTWAVEVKHYLPHSWKEVPEAKRRYRAALQRHENAIARGEVNDPESGLPHRAHIACNSLFLAELDYIKE